MLGEKLAELVSFIGEDKAKALSVYSAKKAIFMSATSIENISDFVRDLNSLIGVHQHPVDQ